MLRTVIAALVTATLALGLVVAAPASAATELMVNPTVESGSGQSPTGYTASKSGTNDAALTWNSTGGHDGTHSLAIAISTLSSGEAKWLPNSAKVTSGAAYTVSLWYKATVTTMVAAEAWSDDWSTYKFVWLGDLTARADWTQFQASVTAPAGTTNLRFFQTLSRPGTLETDTYSLVAGAAPPPSSGQNMVANASAELTGAPGQPAAWTTTKSGTNNAAFTWATGGGHSGDRSLQTQITSYTSGEAKWVMEEIPVAGGGTYSVGDWYTSTGPSYLAAEAWNDTWSVYKYSWLGQRNPTDVWTPVQYSVTVPFGATRLRVYHILNGAGTLRTDDTWVVQGSVAAPTIPLGTNLVSNGGFETAAPGGSAPLSWSPARSGNYVGQATWQNGVARTGSRSVLVSNTSGTNGEAKWVMAPVPVKQQQLYTYSAWYKSTVPTTLGAEVWSDDWSFYRYIWLGSLPAASDWSKVSFPIETPPGTTNVRVIDSLTGLGTLQLDDVSITQVAPPAPLNRGLVSVAFDDGLATICDSAIPAMNARGITSTQYVSSAKLGTSGYCTAAQIAAASAGGHEIGSHSMSHPHLTQLTPQQVAAELDGDRSALQAITGTAVTDFADPYGETNATVTAAVASRFASQRTTDWGYVGRDNFDPYRLVVHDAFRDTTAAEVQGWLARAAADKTWLIIVYHGVQDTGDQFDITQTQLNSHLDVIKASGLPIKTVRDGLAEVAPQAGS